MVFFADTIRPLAFGGITRGRISSFLAPVMIIAPTLPFSKSGFSLSVLILKFASEFITTLHPAASAAFIPASIISVELLSITTGMS